MVGAHPSSSLPTVPPSHPPAAHSSPIGEYVENDGGCSVSLSLWLLSCGIHKIGTTNLKTAQDSEKFFDGNGHDDGIRVSHDAVLLQWHCQGEKICSIVDGEIIFVTIVWSNSKKDGNETNFSSVMLIEFEGSDEDVLASLPRCHLNIFCRMQLHATSLCGCGSKKILLVGCTEGSIMAINWRGEILYKIMIPSDYYIFRVGLSVELTFLHNDLISCQSNISFANVENESKPLVDLPFVCGYSSRLCLSVLHMGDGSMSFMHVSNVSWKLTSRVVPVFQNAHAGSSCEKEIIPRMYCARLIDCPTVCSEDDCLIAAILISRHSGEMKKSDENFRQYISLMVMRVACASREVPIDPFLNVSCCSRTYISRDFSGEIILDNCLHLDVVYVEAEPLLVVSTSSYISCRSIRDCAVKIFNISFSEFSLRSSLSFITSPATYLSCDGNYSELFMIKYFTITFGKIFIFGEFDSVGRSLSSKDAALYQKMGIVVSFSLKISLSSERLTQANGVLLDVSSGCIHIYDEVDDLRSSNGTFVVLDLPKGIRSDFAKQQLKSFATSFQLHQGRFLVALSPECPVPISGLNSRFSKSKYVLCAVTDSGSFGSIIGNSYLTLWIFNRRTYRWRIVKTELSTEGPNFPRKNIYRHGSSAISNKEPGSLRTLYSLYWYGEHTMILLGAWNARVHIQIVSQEFSRPSHFSQDTSIVCFRLPLHSGFIPKFVDAFEVNISRNVANSGTENFQLLSKLNSDELTFHFCSIMVGDGVTFFAYKIVAHQCSGNNILNYSFVADKYTAIREPDVNLIQTFSPEESEFSKKIDFEYEQSKLVFPVTRVRILLDPMSTQYRHSITYLLLDEVGNLYYICKMNRKGKATLDGRFGARKVLGNCCCINKSTATILAAFTSQGAIYLDEFGVSVLLGCKYPKGFDGSLYGSFCSTYQVEESKYIWFPLVHASALTIVLENRILHHSQLISVSGSVGSLAHFARGDIHLRLNDNCEYHTITRTMDEFLIKIAESYCSIGANDIVCIAYPCEIYFRFLQHTRSSSIGCGSSGIFAMSIMYTYFHHLRQLPKLLNVTLRVFEDRLMGILDNSICSRHEVGYDTSIFSLFKSDLSIALELLCRLSRKTHPIKHEVIFHFPYDRRGTELRMIRAICSVLSVFELSISAGLLSHAARLLTICCSWHEIGGLERPTGTVRSLVLAMELLYQCLRRISMNSTLDVLNFMFRLEDILEFYAKELLSHSKTNGSSLRCDMATRVLSEFSGRLDERSDCINCSYSRSPATSIANTGSTTIYSDIGSQMLSLSPTLYSVGGGMIWSLSKTAKAFYYPFKTFLGVQSIFFGVDRSACNPSAVENFWCGPAVADYVKLCGSTSPRGIIEEQIINLSETPNSTSGVITMMPPATASSWTAYIYMDSIYGSFGVESLFYSKLFVISFIFHFLKESLTHGKYCTCAIIAHSVIPSSEGSKSAFFRLLRIKHRSILGDKEYSSDDNSSVDILESILSSFFTENLTLSVFRSRLQRSLRLSDLHSICEKEPKYVPNFLHGHLNMRNTAGTLPTHCIPHVATARSNVWYLFDDEMVKMENQRSESVTFTDTTYAREMKIYGLFLGLFCAFFVIDKKEVAAMIAVLMNRIDIACLCLNNLPPRSEDENLLFRFCIGSECEGDTTSNPEGTEKLVSLLDTYVWKGRKESEVIKIELLSKIMDVFRIFVDDSM